MLIVQGVPPRRRQQWWGGDTSYFEAKCVNISKIVGDTSKVTIYDWQEVCMYFQLTPRSVTLDNPELYNFEFWENLAGFRIFWTQQQINEWR